MRNNEALMKKDPNDANFVKDLSERSEEIGALASEQAMLARPISGKNRSMS